MDGNPAYHEQKIAYARASLWAPFYTVGMAARFQGDAPVDCLKAALRKLQIMYPPLASRVRVEQDGSAWLTTEGVGEFPLEVRARQSDDDLAQLFLEQEQIPFPFDRGPVTRFFLLRGDPSSEVIAIAPHVVCDGYSMTHVMSDLVALLNDPAREVLPPAPAPYVSWQTIPHETLDNIFVRGLARAVNLVWPGRRRVLRQDDYEEMHRSYWARQQHGILTFKLSREETSRLTARCKAKGVSVTGALVAAFLLAQKDFHPELEFAGREVSVPVNIRDRMTQPPGRVVGVFCSAVDWNMPAHTSASFWELARASHVGIHKALNDRQQILMPLVLEEVDPLISDSFIESMAQNHLNQFRLISHYVKVNEDTRALIISNIGRIDLPDVGSPYKLETLVPFPPLVPGSRLALNVLTVDGQMNMIFKYRQDQLNGTAVKIRDRALSYLSGEERSAN